MKDTFLHTILEDKATTGEGTAINVMDAETLGIALDTDSSTLTVKFAGSIQESAPDFTATQSKDNQYVYLDVIDIADGASIDGGTGISTSSAVAHRQFKVDVTAFKWFNAIVTARTGGSVTVKARTFVR